MKRTIILTVFVFIAFFCFFIPHSNAAQELPFDNPDTTISMDFQDANLKDIMKIFSIQSGLNFIASEAVQNRKITLYLDKVPIKEAMDKLFKANNLSYELENDSNIIIVKDWGKPQTETITKVFYLKHAILKTSSLTNEKNNKEIPNSDLSVNTGGSTSASSSSSGSSSSASTTQDEFGITSAIKKILSSNGSIMEDPRTNSLVVTDIPSKMPVIEQVIASLDIFQPEIMLEVEMLDVSKDLVDKLGFDWTNTTSFSLSVASAHKGIHFPFSTGKTASTTSSSTLASVFDFLKTQTDVKSLARPKVLTLNNETAEIMITTNEVIGVKTTQSSTSGGTSTQTIEAERTLTGVQLRITPQVNPETEEITMFLIPSLTDKGLKSTLGDFFSPETRGTKSVVRVKNGETIILGGLLKTEFNQDETQLPFLGDIPIAGALFRHKNKSTDKERELMVFITPHIIKEAGIELAQTKKLPLLEREQGTFSGAERFTTINSSLNNFEPKKR